MGTDLNIGHVTAYAYAKSKGYTGTEEQFATELAQFAQNAQRVAEDRAAVEQLVDEFLNTTAPAVIQDVTDEGTSQVERVANAGTAQVTRVGQAGDAQIDAVASAGTTQIGLVTAEGTTQVTRVQDKGDEVIDSIPADYTELTQEVSDLNQQITKLANDKTISGTGGYVSTVYDFVVGNAYEITNNTSGTISCSTRTGIDSSATNVESITNNINAGDSYTFVPTLNAPAFRAWLNAAGNVSIKNTSAIIPTLIKDVDSIESRVDAIPTNYISDLQTNLYVYKEPVNIFGGSFTANKIINASGEVASLDGYHLSDYFSVKSGKKIYCSRQASENTRMIQTVSWAFFNSSKEFIGRETAVSTPTTIPNNTAFIRFYLVSDYATGDYKLMVEYGDGTNIAPTYSVYFEPYYCLLQPDFAGKKICAFGDSIAASDNGQRNTFTWVDMVANYFGATAYNRGIGTSCVTDETDAGVARTGYSYVNASGDAGAVRVVYETQQSFDDYPTEITPWMCDSDRADTIPEDTDIVVIIAGTNDVGTTTIDGFKTAYRTMLNNIIARVPNAKIYPCTLPFQQNYDLGTPTLYNQYRTAISDVAKEYGFVCIDLRSNMGVNSQNYSTYMNDATHYNTPKGRAKIAECVIATLKDYSLIQL